MASFIDAVIIDGPNKGKTIGECLCENYVPVEASDLHSAPQALSKPQAEIGDKPVA